MNLSRYALLCSILGVTSACAATGGGPIPETVERLARLTPLDDAERKMRIVSRDNPLERDRAAILAMQGEYAVSFAFTETVALKSGYARRQDKTTSAYETVLVIEDQPHKIVLQHLLVSDSGGRVIKHWRQDWHYEAPARWEFTEDQTWRITPLPAQLSRSAWTQCVYEVSDAPRYCGTGAWNHRHGTPTWTSDRGWRPLPRREYTQRSDYNAVNAENRHSITPTGWTHEQDNTKTVRSGEKVVDTLVREYGFNDYRRIDGFDFKPAYDYWTKTQDYWAQVRAAWARRMDAHQGLTLKTAVDGTALINPLFALAELVVQGGRVDAGQIEAIMQVWVSAPGTTVAAPAAPAPKPY